MANGHIQIHDLFSGHSTSPELPSDTESMENSVEYRIMMVYNQRRSPVEYQSPSVEKDENSDANNASQPGNEAEETTMIVKKKKKKKGWKRLSTIFKCVSPPAEDLEEPQEPPNDGNVAFRCLTPVNPPQEVIVDNEIEEVVSRLTEIIDDVPFLPPEFEADAPEDNYSREVETMLALLLRAKGDEIHENELLKANIASELFWNYGFFKTLLNALLRRMGLRRADPDAPVPQASPKTQIAVTCEVTSRLSAINTLPMSRLLDHGARYLQDYFSTWARQQGGYETAFEEDEVE